jgi:8-oxo-dGTP pyrophosphatase MutT (NUDIX family)
VTPIRDAATVLVVRDGDHGVEVLLLLRTSTLDFSPGAHVFPGGAVDDADRAPEAAAWCTGHTDASASAALGIPSGGLAYFLAAVRECFEEVGIVLGVDPAVVPALAAAREAVHGGDATFLDAVAAAGGSIALDTLVPFGHWITPPGGTRRYDTRFFVTVAPDGQAPTPDEREAVAVGWHRPADVLEAAARGELVLILPTQRSLEAIAESATVAELMTGVPA